MSCPKIGLHKLSVNGHTTRAGSQDLLQSGAKTSDLQRTH